MANPLADPVFLIITALLLGIVFMLFLFFRRTITAFKEGAQDTKRR